MSEGATTADATGEKSAFGLDQNLAAALACFFSWTLLVPLVFFVSAEDEFTKVYALQSLLIGVIGWLLSWIFIGFIAWLLALFMAWKAYNNEMFEVPVIYGFAQDYA